MKSTYAILALLCVFSITSPQLTRGDVLLSEDFEGFTLKPYQSGTESGGDGTDWTDELPAGWTTAFFGPVGDPIEFQGWRIHDVDSWIATEENQDRSTWSAGNIGQRNSAMIVDPDAYDDGTDLAIDNMFATVQTPSLDISNIGEITVSLDSFLRNEVPSDYSVDVVFNDGSMNLAYYDSELIADALVIDEHLSFTFPNPGSQSMMVSFSLLFGDNDWWWAIDNVNVEGVPVPEPSAAILLVLAGITAWGVRRRRR